MKKAKRILALALAFALAFTSVLVFDTSEVNATSKTSSEAISWVQSKLGTGIDWDGYYGAQCVDLIAAYYNYLGVTTPGGNGCDYATNALPSGWTRVKGGQPQKGDILVYSGNSSNPYGHVAIYESDYVHYHQNFAGHSYVEKVTYKYNGLGNPYWGYIRPNWSSAVKPGNCTISVTKGTSAAPTTWSWTKASNAKTYNLRIKKYNGSEYVTYTDVWNLTGTSHSILLPPGDYYAYVDACNGSQVTRSTNSAYCTIKYWYAGRTINDLGDDFYARIVLTHTNVAPGVNPDTKNIENVSYESELDANYISQSWHFVKNSDGSYRILNAYYKDLPLEALGRESGSNVVLGTYYKSNDSQNWYIYGDGNGKYIIRNKASEFVLNIHNAYSAVGTNLQIWKYTDSVAERMTIEKHTEHIFEWVIDIEPTEERPGLKHEECVICGETRNEDTEINQRVHEHVMIKTDKQESTCIEEGNIEYWTCETCGDIFADADGLEEITEADTVIETGDHSFGDWVVTKEATETETGEKVRECTVCGETEYEDIPMIETDILWGDADDNGRVLANDAMLVLQYSTKMLDGSAIKLEVCDVDGNGRILANDAMMILQYSTKVISKFPVEM